MGFQSTTSSQERSGKGACSGPTARTKTVDLSTLRRIALNSQSVRSESSASMCTLLSRANMESTARDLIAHMCTHRGGPGIRCMGGTEDSEHKEDMDKVLMVKCNSLIK